MLKPFPIFCAAILIVFAATPTLGHMPQEAAPSPTGAAVKSPAKITPESQAKAKKLYGIDCEICHGANGNGKTDVGKSMELKIADWTDPASLSGKTDQELFNIIRQGKDKMPAEGDGRAKDDDVWNLIAYIRGLSKGPTAPAAAPADKPAN